MISAGEIQGQLDRLARSAPQIKRSCDTNDVRQAVGRICDSIGASGEDLSKVIAFIVETAKSINASTMVPNLIAEAFTSMGGIRGQANGSARDCKLPLRLCNQHGILYLELPNGEYTSIFCPFCQKGRARRVDERYSEQQKEWAGEESYAARQKMIRQAVIGLRDTFDL